MTEKTIEEYRKEMLKMYEKAKPVVAQPFPFIGDPEDTGRGTVIIVVTSNRGALPVSGAIVTVSRVQDNTVIATMRTNENGQTTPLSLSAPKRMLSESPSTTNERPFSLYNITVSADGFVGENLEGVPVFDGVTSLQQMDLISMSASGGNSSSITDVEPDPYQL